MGIRIVIPDYHITEYSVGQIYDHHKYLGLKVIKVIYPRFKKEKLKLVDFVTNFMRPILDIYLKHIKSQNRMGCLVFIVSTKHK